MRLAPRVTADHYQRSATASSRLALLFHSSNGNRHDLTQLAWSLAQGGMDAMTLTWLSGTVRNAYPVAYTDVRCALADLAREGVAHGDRELCVVTWADGSLPVLTELNRLASHGRLRPRITVVTLAGVFGWPFGVPHQLTSHPGAIEFFGGRTDPSDPIWTDATPYASLTAGCASMRLVSVAPSDLVEETIAYHEAARVVGVETRLIEWDGVPIEMIVPRLRAGRAVRQLILGTGRDVAASE